MTDKTSLSYKDAGVDIDAGNALVDRIKGVVKKTRRPEVMGGLGGFGALCALPQKYREPVLVSGTDGVGTIFICFGARHEIREFRACAVFLSKTAFSVIGIPMILTRTPS